MTDTVRGSAAPLHRSDHAQARLRRRRMAELRFQAYGIAAICFAVSVLALLIGSIAYNARTAFTQTEVTLDVVLDPAEIDPDGSGDPAIIRKANFQGMLNDAVYALFPEATARTDRRAMRDLISLGSGPELRNRVLADPDLIGRTMSFSAVLHTDLDQYHKGKWARDLSENQRPRRLSDRHLSLYEGLMERGLVSSRFNVRLFVNPNSDDAEMAGILGAAIGSAYALAVCFLISFPLGVGAAIYLEEFAPRNRLTDLIEVNINNLAAVPSIIFGLLGLAVLIQIFGLPRSVPLVGGMVLALMTLPTIIIAARAALKSVPPSIREASLGMGASGIQTVLHHVLPLAMPGILTGTIIGMAQALGETAPLVMIGMNNFIPGLPGGIDSPTTALPAQIYIWADRPERGFAERTSAAILILVVFLVMMNGLAIWLRKRFERRW